MDELERRIRAANPHPIQRDDALGERAERELALLMSEPWSARTICRGTVPTVLPTAVAVLLVTLAAIGACSSPRGPRPRRRHS